MIEGGERRRLERIRVTTFFQALLVVGACYLLCGATYSLVSLCCYNLRNWEVSGGFSLMPLFLPGVVFDLFLWPVYLWADWHNRVGVFGGCK